MSRMQEIRITFDSGRTYTAQKVTGDHRPYWVIRKFNKEGDKWDTKEVHPERPGRLHSIITPGQVFSEIEDWEHESEE